MELRDKTFGLTGGIGTGKSAVAKIFLEMGAHIIDTDLIAREVVEPGKSAYLEVAEYFGREVLNPDGTLNRELLRDRIIRDRTMREKLNAITHPRIGAIVTDRIESCKRINDGMPVIVDIPLLYEVGWDRFFPDVILAYAPVFIQISRLIERDMIDRETAELAIAAQMSIEEKKKKAVYIIDNSGTLEKTRVQVVRLFEVLRKEISGER